MSTAKKSIGLKRICPGCGDRFYDLNKRPIICPICGIEFTGEIKVKRRGRSPAEVKKDDPIKSEAANTNNDEIIEDEDDGVEVVSLEDVETAKDEDDGEVMEEDTLDDIPDLGEDLAGDLGDDDTLLDDDED